MASWTPQVKFGGANTGMTYTTQTGVYEQWQNFIFYTVNITLSNKGSSTGNITITGWPLAHGSSDLIYPTTCCYHNNVNTILNAGTPIGLLQTDVMTIYNFAITLGTNTNLTHAFYNNNTQLCVTGIYSIL